MRSVVDRNVIMRRIHIVLLPKVCARVHDEGDDDNEHVIALEN